MSPGGIMQDLEKLFNEKGKRINKYLNKLFPEEKQIIYMMMEITFKPETKICPQVSLS